MITLFIVIGSEVLQCVGVRFCDGFSPVELTRMWELGLVEVMFEGVLGSVAIKIYRRTRDRFKGLRADRLDKKL